MTQDFLAILQISDFQKQLSQRQPILIVFDIVIESLLIAFQGLEIAPVGGIDISQFKIQFGVIGIFCQFFGKNVFRLDRSAGQKHRAGNGKSIFQIRRRLHGRYLSSDVHHFGIFSQNGIPFRNRHHNQGIVRTFRRRFFKCLQSQIMLLLIITGFDKEENRLRILRRGSVIGLGIDKRLVIKTILEECFGQEPPGLGVFGKKFRERSHGLPGQFPLAPPQTPPGHRHSGLPASWEIPL